MNKVIVAVAGAGKTRRIASEVAAGEQQERILVLTYTQRNQSEDANRIAQSGGCVVRHSRVMGWMAFLLNEIVRPYLPLLFPSVTLRGLGVDPKSLRGLKKKARYFNKKGDAYPGTLPKLAFDVIKASKGAPIKRLERLYDAIYIDEAQDLCGNDREIVSLLFKSSISTTVVLDPRQSVLSTSKRDTKGKEYNGVNSLSFYREQEKKGSCSIEMLNETYRFIPEIAQLSDLVFGDEFGFTKTESYVTCEEEHRGIFAISKEQIEQYALQNNATILRWDKRSGKFPGLPVANFGECKGMQRNYIVIIPTKPMTDFFLKGTSLSDEGACKLYVAITRARYGVAIVFDDPVSAAAAMSAKGSAFSEVGIKVWNSA